MRFAALDGLRGLFLVFMTMGHVSYVLKGNLELFTYHALGWADAAHGFVFLSGLVVGLVYMRRLERDGAAAMGASVFRRCRLIFLHMLAIAVLTGAMAAWLAPHAPAAWVMMPQAKAPWLFTGLSALALTGPTFGDVLQMYLVFMLLTPLALRLVARGQGLALLTASLFLWVVPQIGLTDLFWDGMDRLTGLDGTGLSLGLFFDRLAWQLVYFGGLLIGAETVRGRLSSAMLRDPRWRPVMAVCGLALLGLAVLQLLSPGNLPAQPGDKTRLSVLYLANVAAIGLPIAWLLTAGPADAAAWVRGLARGLGAVVTWRPLVFLGQHSLQVFSWHVIAVYLAACFVPGRALPLVLRDVLGMGVVASLFAAAWLHARWQRRAARPSGRRLHAA